jgi:signal transduction histidine kinase
MRTMPAMTPKIFTPQELEHLLNAQIEPVEDLSTGLESPLLRLLASVERGKLMALLSERRCVNGETIVQEGEQGDAFYLIWSGRAVVYAGDWRTPDVLGFRGAGEVIGEMALLENQPRSASVVALGETRLLKISRSDFFELLKNDPTISLSILGALSRRLRQADQARSQVRLSEKQLIDQLSELKSEKEQLMELERLRQETSDLIVHDLRNPLGSISLALHMLEMVLPEDILNENRQLLEIARYSNNRMLQLVESLLDVARMEAGQAHLAFEAFELAEFIRCVIGGLLVARKRDIQVETHLPESIKIVADPEKLERVLLNLLDNALKFTPNGGTIKISAQQRGDEALIRVSDTGPGIPEHERQYVFERFAQIPGEQRTRRGFGLGLAYCRLAVEAHGGRIWVESGEDGKGSSFCFTLSNPIDARNI